MHTRDVIGEESARETYRMAVYGITRSGSLGKRGKEKQVGRGSERWEHEWIVREHSYERQQPYCHKAVQEYI